MVSQGLTVSGNISCSFLKEIKLKKKKKKKTHTHENINSDFFCLQIWLKEAMYCDICKMVCHKKCVEKCKGQTFCTM